MTTATKTRKAVKQDPLDALAQGDPKRVIALMLWKARHRQPDMFVQITEHDIKGFEDCVTYMKVKPDLMIKHPPGLPATPAIPAVGTRRALPAREATPPKPYVIVTLVEEGTENVIRPVENNQEDYDIAQDSARLRKARDQAPGIAERILNQARSGEFSLSEIQDAADALIILARAQQT